MYKIYEPKNIFLLYLPIYILVPADMVSLYTFKKIGRVNIVKSI